MANEASMEWIPPVEKLTDDLLVEILSRVPYKSLCRSKCICRRWCHAISHPNHRHLLPRYHLHSAVSGFFHSNSYTNVAKEGRPLIDPMPPFLPNCECLHLLDCCNGLLLYRRWSLDDPRRYDHLVVNPATEQWVILPNSGRSKKMQAARLGFGPMVSSSHFHVFEFVEDWAAYIHENSDQEDCDGYVR